MALSGGRLRNSSTLPRRIDRFTHRPGRLLNRVNIAPARHFFLAAST
jgi:hypothetical protein